MTTRLLPFLSLVAAVGIFFAYINPLWNGPIAIAKAGIAQDNAALASAAEYVKRENELSAQVSAIDPAALARLEAYLPDSVDNVGLILDMNALAGRSGLALSAIDVSAVNGNQTSTTGAAAGAGNVAAAAGTDTADPVGTIDMTLSAKGTYDALIAFLRGIELSERLLDVKDLTVTGGDTGVYDYQMTVRLYWLR